MVHLIMVEGYLGELDIFNGFKWEPRGLPLGEIGASQLVHAYSRSSP